MEWAVPLLRPLVAGFPSEDSVLDPKLRRRICGAQSGTGECFLRALWFPLPIFIPPSAPYSLGILSSMLYSTDTENAVKRPA
jgi:hypothetical protein